MSAQPPDKNAAAPAQYQPAQGSYPGQGTYPYPPYYAQHPLYGSYASWGAMFGGAYPQNANSAVPVETTAVPSGPGQVSAQAGFRPSPSKVPSAANGVQASPNPTSQGRLTNSPVVGSSQQPVRVQGLPPKHRVGALAGRLLDADLPALAIPTSKQYTATLLSDPGRTFSSSHTDLLGLGGPDKQSLMAASNRDDYLLKLLHNTKRTGLRRAGDPTLSTDVSKTMGVTMDSRGSGGTRLQQQHLLGDKVSEQMPGPGLSNMAPPPVPSNNAAPPPPDKWMTPLNAPGPPPEPSTDVQTMPNMFFPYPPPTTTNMHPASVPSSIPSIPPPSQHGMAVGQAAQQHAQHVTTHVQPVAPAVEDKAKSVESALGSSVYQQFREVLLKQQEVYVQQMWELHRLVQLQKHLVNMSDRKSIIKSHLNHLEQEGFPNLSQLQLPLPVPPHQHPAVAAGLLKGPGPKVSPSRDPGPAKHRQHQSATQPQPTGQLSVTARQHQGPMGGPAAAGALALQQGALVAGMWGPQGPPPAVVEQPPRAGSGELQENHGNGSNGTSGSPNAQHGQSRPPNSTPQPDAQPPLPTMPQMHYFLHPPDPSNPPSTKLPAKEGAAVPASGSGGSGGNGSRGNGSGANGSGANGSGTQQGGSCQASNPAAAAEATAQGDIPRPQVGAPPANAMQVAVAPGGPPGPPAMAPLLLSGYASIPPGAPQGGGNMAPPFQAAGYNQAAFNAAYGGYAAAAAAAAAAQQGPPGAQGPPMDPMMAWYQQQYGQMMGQMAGAGPMMGQSSYQAAAAAAMYGNRQASSGGSMPVPSMPPMRWWQDPMAVFGAPCVPDMMTKGPLAAIASQSRGANTSETSKPSGTKRQHSMMTGEPASPYR